MKLTRLLSTKFLKSQNKRLLLCGFGVFALLLLFFNTAGIFLYVTSNQSDVITHPIVRKLLPVYHPFRDSLKIAQNLFYVPRMFSLSDLPHYELQILPKDLRILNEALPDPTSLEVIEGRALLDESRRKKVPGLFIYEGEEYEVTVSYRGDNPNHWSKKKRSWQVRFKKKNPFRGIRTLKFILPKDRNYLAEQLNNHRAQKFGLVYPEAQFAKLTVNGRTGVYHEVEGWSPAIFEKKAFPSDVNLYATNDEVLSPALAGSNNTEIFNDEWFFQKESQDTIFEFSNFGELTRLLDAIELGDRETVANLVDLDNFYKWNALALLSGSDQQTSGVVGDNIRIYFNTSKGKFQFIAWDVGINQQFNVVPNKLAEVILNDEGLVAQKKVLWEYVKDKQNLKDDLVFYDSLYTRVRTDFYRDFLKVDANRKFDKSIENIRNTFEDNFKTVRNFFSKDDSRTIISYDSNKRLVSIHVDVNSFGGILPQSLSFAHKGYLGGSLYFDENKDGKFNSREDIFLGYASKNQEEDALIFKNTFPVLSSVSRSVIPAPYTFFVVLDKSTFALSSNTVTFKAINAITGEDVEMKEIRLSDVSTFSNINGISQSPQTFASAHSMFTYRNGDLVVFPGSYFVSDTIIVPENTKLSIRPGVIIYFSQGASLISYSPIEAIGTTLNPIELRPARGNVPWGVLGIMNTGKEESVLRFVQLNGGSGAYVNGVRYTGMLSAYHSDIIVSDTSIHGASDDDGLNVKYGNLEIARSTFLENGADALDLDFSTGVVRESLFEKNGNDAIDISGSTLTIRDNTVLSSGDKCISVGEKSLEPIIFNNILTGCLIGIEIKDASTPFIVNNVITGNTIGLNSYLKKPIFLKGGASKVYNSIVRENDIQVQEDATSRTKISYSAVEGGYKGKGNIDHELYFKEDGDSDILNELFSYDISKAPIGLFKK